MAAQDQPGIQAYNHFFMTKTEIHSQFHTLESQLAETQRDLDAFLYRASHELKGPLARVEGLIQMMQSQSADPQVQFSVKLLETLTQEMQGVINSLIHVQDLLAAEPVYHQVNPQLLLQEVLADPALNGLVLSLHVNLEVDAGPWRTDPMLARIILLELFKNALAYKKPGAEPGIDLGLRQELGYWVLSVRDQGIGMTTAEQDRIFEPFFKGNEASAGNGLGLYLVRKAVFQLKGKITVASEPGQGSHFEIQFPKA
jgi:signal transduction histidine kinase